jgi:phage shock protein A
MGILSRFVNVVRANLNWLLNLSEDPSKMLEQTLIDLEGAYRKAKDQVAHSVADQKRLEKSLLDQQAEIKRWEERAVIALEKNNEALAKEALLRKKEHTRLAAQFQGELNAHTSNVDRLKDSLHELENKIAEIRRKKGLLISKQRRAEAQNQIYKTMEGIKDAGAVEVIDRMERKIEDMAALADARHEMSEEFSGDPLERKFESLGADDQDVDAELLELKQRLQIEHKGGG